MSSRDEKQEAICVNALNCYSMTPSKTFFVFHEARQHVKLFKNEIWRSIMINRTNRLHNTSTYSSVAIK